MYVNCAGDAHIPHHANREQQQVADQRIHKIGDWLEDQGIGVDTMGERIIRPLQVSSNLSLSSKQVETLLDWTECSEIRTSRLL